MEYTRLLLIILSIVSYSLESFQDHDVVELNPQEVRYGTGVNSDPEKNFYDYNVKVLDQIGQPGTIVHPVRLENRRKVDISTRVTKIRHHGTHEHLHHVTFQIVLNGKKYKIKLDRNEDLLSSGIVVKHYEKQNGEIQQIFTKTIEHCYYHGEVKKDEWSRVAVSTCNGIRGVIQMQNKTYVIQPLHKNEGDSKHPHVIFEASASPDEKCGNSQGLWSPFQELYQGELTRKTKFIKAQQRMYHSKVDVSEKHLRIGLVVDKLLYMGMKLSHQDVIEYAVDITNIVNLYYQELDFKIALTYLELWSEEDQFPVDPQHRSLLSRFLHFHEKYLPTKDFDAAFFVTGGELDDNKVGVAIPDSICSDRAVAVIKSGKPFEPQQTATILSHMAGHILGIQHDEDGGCVCNDAFGCIMSTEVLGHQGYHSRMFSTCSSSDLEGGLNTGIASCLWGAPKVQTDFKQICGNSLVERGEECDCGSAEECKLKDPCCDPSTCLLQPWAQCRSGPCCRNCSFLSSDHMCSPRQSECDVPEFCDGSSGNCPTNTYIQDGHPCAGGKGYCVGGVCPTVHNQCQGIWGKDAKGGHEQCFSRFNPTGSSIGHCGKNKETGSYAKCRSRDLMCGLLHCEGGVESPLHSSDKGFAKTHVNANGIEYECKVVHGPAMMNIPHMGMVKDGTKCGHNKICRSNACVELAVTHTFDCPTSGAEQICSGHGVCAPNKKCFCDRGWEGSDCSTASSKLEEKKHYLPLPLPSTKEPSGTDVKLREEANENSGLIAAIDTKNLPEVNELGEANTPSTSPVTEEKSGISTTLLIIILCTVIGGLILCMGITLLCYRRRSPSKATDSETKDGKSRRCGKKGKKCRSTSEEESELGEMPAPPIIITDPNSAAPGRSILKNPGNGLYSQEKDEDGDQDSTGPYMFDDNEDDDDDACDDDAEIQDIFEGGGSAGSAENMNQLQESASFDFVIPPPPPTLPEPHYYSSPLAPQPQGPPSWRTALPPQTLSPPQSRIVKLRNLSDFHQQSNIDLSPSPEDEENPFLGRMPSSQQGTLNSDPQSPSSSQGSSGSSTGVQASNEPRPSLGSLSKYILGGQNKYHQQPQHNNLNLNRGSPPHQLQDQDMPPPMNPINIRTILGGLHNHNHAHSHNHNHYNVQHPHHVSTPGSTVSRDSNTSLHMTTDLSVYPDGNGTSFNGGSNYYGTGTSGYSSEHDQADHMVMPVLGSRSNSHSLSRSHSGSPPSYSAVIRTGPNQIQLVPAPVGQDNGWDGCGEGREIEGIQQELNKLLENLPRIDAGSFARTPLTQASNPGTPGTPLSGRPAMSQGSSPGTPLMARSTLSQGSFTGSPLVSRQANKDEAGDSSAPCIDRSLEEIPAQFVDKRVTSEVKDSDRDGDYLLRKVKRPVSVAVQGKQSSTGSDLSLEEGQSLLTEESGALKV